MKKIYVMIGNYGSGKSELALNFAFKAAETGKTELIDLDLVNTYFRLTERGIDVSNVVLSEFLIDRE